MTDGAATGKAAFDRCTFSTGERRQTDARSEFQTLALCNYD
jgi:hypothetical protein